MAKIIGLDKLNGKLKQIAAIDLSAAVLKGSLRVEREAKILVPVDTGLLRSSITHSVEGNKGMVGTSVEYAPKVELGIGQRPQPFLEPALRSQSDNIKRDIIEELERKLREVAAQ